MTDPVNTRGQIGEVGCKLVRRYKFSMLVVFSSCILCGCSLIQDKSLNYQDAKVVSPIATPNGVVNPRRGQAYPVPVLSRSSSASAAFVPSEDTSVPRNTSDVGVGGMKEVKLERYENDRPYLTVSRPRAGVYSSVQQFIKANKLAVDEADEAAGIIKLAPLKPVLQDKKRWWQLGKARPRRYQFTLKVGRDDAGLSTVAMDHQVWEQRGGEGGDWKVIRTNDPDDFASVEAILLDLGQFIDADEKDWRSPMVARRYESLPKVVRSIDGTGYPVITVVSDYNQAWSRVENALEASQQMLLQDKNRSEGVFLVKVDGADGLLQLRLDRVETGVVITLQRDDNTLAPLPLTESLITELENALQA